MKLFSRLAAIPLALCWGGAWAACSGADCCTSTSGATGNGDCSIQPDEYGITIYRVGICTSAPSAPTAGTTADISSCTTVFESTGGATVTITPSGSSALPGPFTQPPVGTYTHGYVLMSPTFNITTEFAFSTSRTATSADAGSGTTCWTKAGTFYSWGGTPTFNCGNTVSGKGTLASIMNAFGGSAADYDASETFTSPSGISTTMSAYLVKSDLTLGTTASSGSAGDIARLLGIATLAATVTSATTGMNLGFKASRGGTIAYGTGGDSKINGIYGGPFQVVLTLTP